MRVPSHTTVVAYLALFVAVGGSAYAVSKIGSSEIKNQSIRGKDVAANTLGGRQIDERRLDGPTAVGTEQSGACDPPPGTPIDCIRQTINLTRESSLLVIVTGNKGARPGSGVCTMAVDGVGSNSTSLGGSDDDGFALTKITSRLPAGTHAVTLRCTEANPDLIVDNPTIAAVAINAP